MKKRGFVKPTLTYFVLLEGPYGHPSWLRRQSRLRSGAGRIGLDLRLGAHERGGHAGRRQTHDQGRPAETNGIGTPMTGKTPTTTPMLISACPTSHTVMHSRLTDA